MSNQQKDKVLEVIVRITKEDRKRADEFLELQRRGEKEEEQVNGNGSGDSLVKQKMVSSKMLKTKVKQKPVYSCDYCHKKFPSPSHLKQHVTVHLGQKYFHCNLCDYSTAYKGDLTVHIRSHLKERPFKCLKLKCGASFTKASHLKRHELVHNKKYKSFPCSMCPYKAGRKEHLSGHMKTVHSESRPFKCPHANCEYSAKQKSDLTKHSKIHSQEKNHVCPHPNCGYKTKWTRALKRHLKTHSTGEKSFKCQFCDYSCNHHHNLIVQIRQHTGETPYACHLCPYESKTKSHLNQHVKKH